MGMRVPAKVCITSIKDNWVHFKVYNSDTITIATERKIPLEKFLEWIVGLSVPCAEIAVEELKDILKEKE